MRLAGFGIVIAASLLLLGTGVHARPRSFGIAVSSGYQTYSMSNLNEEVIAPGPLLPGATLDLNGGLGFGAGIRVHPAERILVAVDVSRLLASAEGKGTLSGHVYDWRLGLPASAATLTVTYYVAGSSNRLGFGGGVGYYVADGEAKTVNPSGELISELRGNGAGAHALLVGELPLTDRFRVELGGGYRWARTRSVTFENRLLGESSHSSHIDWSGFTARAGVAWYFVD
jgi:hypothetical protein